MGRSENTLISYQTDISHLIKFLMRDVALLEVRHITSCDRPTMRAFISSYRDIRGKNKHSTRSAARCLSAVRSFLDFLSRIRGYETSNASSVRGPRVRPTLPRPAPHSELMQMQEEMHIAATYMQAAADYHKERWAGLRDVALFMLIYGSGMRISEALGLRHSDMRDIKRGMLVIRGKGGKEREVPILRPVYAALEEYIHACPHKFSRTSPLFFGVRGRRLQAAIFQRTMRYARTTLNMDDSLTPHALRHSFATALLAGGADLRSVQQLLGHESLTSTQIYTKVEKSAIFAAYEDLHPRASTHS